MLVITLGTSDSGNKSIFSSYNNLVYGQGSSSKLVVAGQLNNNIIMEPYCKVILMPSNIYEYISVSSIYYSNTKDEQTVEILTNAIFLNHLKSTEFTI